ncbi:hypothetical protein TPY_2769 [Sulfobacillus acidophilus TPY]|nr:hypothetical protein TPY_2769 [Sulfobacillus acidophilus TPY]
MPSSNHVSGLSTPDVRTTWAWLFDGHHAVEMRVLTAHGPRIGRFTREDAFVRAVRQAQANPTATGIYATLNPIVTDAVWTAPWNVLTRSPRAAADRDIVARRWLLIDIDPIRPPHTNATTLERHAAARVGQRLVEGLRALGWPDPGVATSGNGIHLLYRIDWPNTVATTTQVRRILSLLAQRFNTPDAAVDESVYNAARITKVYGTTPRKGPATPDRPWWSARILRIPRHWMTVTADHVTALDLWATPSLNALPSRNGSVSRPRLFATSDGLDRLIHWLSQRGLTLAGDPRPLTGDEGWLIPLVCPWEAEHTTPSTPTATAVLWFPDGRIGFRCFHAHCTHRTIRDIWRVTGTPYPSFSTKGGPSHDAPGSSHVK